MSEGRNAYEERKRALAAVERMREVPRVVTTAAATTEQRRALADAYARRHGMRPLRPPPVAIAPATVTAGAAELAREMRRGTYRPARARLFGGDA